MSHTHRLHELLAPLCNASLRQGSWPVVPMASARIAAALVDLGATREGLALPGVAIADEARVPPSKITVELNLLAALLSHYCPGLAVRRVGQKVGRSFRHLYWIENGDASPSPSRRPPVLQPAPAVRR